ncbi:tyrosine--tRNA ligase [Bacteriovorax stolpii]|uniref:Tyrosine--tRNA ligase n=1 Tax=Bacteriovorax stolpii TaxID=960 RepID=A0A2K9NWC0_BACTC|nr:tyrosine--tRNA ligase [Bacteriovorax stolpii]AUN99054.1 tyrosine--tRNA ligase [Bacteriovorax stolpii]QDK40952.1 tyrosine--tRNA ligase [Bacteriovorax stolpii]TDP55419.1 tyrosyl-tRNA synthetase [Bacteriovorax stolpii]
MNFYQELEDRGLIADVSNPELKELLNTKKISFYIGYDPTAKSLQIGNLFAIITMKRFQNAGHKPYVLLGGATGMIGDPSGKSTERVLLTEEVIKENIEAQKKQFQKILKFDGENPAIMVNNYDWMGKFSFLEFLRDVGKKFRISEMIAKESVKKRLESEVGLSFTEFCYQMLQAYDFRHLSLNHDIILQMGGGDQWGNITAGIDYTRKMDGRQVYGLVIPLVTDSNGNKFGKSEGGTAIYLDPEMTSPYQMYQYLLNSEDASVVKYLKYFTFLSLDEIAALEAKTVNEPHLREAQKVLASEVVKLVHGEEGLNAALNATKIFFGEKITNLKDKDLTAIFKDVPSVELKRADLQAGIPLLDLLAQTPLFPSKSEARRSVEQKGVYLNNDTMPEMTTAINESHLASETCMVIRKGKKNYCVIKFA